MQTNHSSSLDAAGADTDVESPGVPCYRLIRAARAPKMGLRSTGEILYQVLTDDSHQEVYLRISGNQGGGFVSDEAVSVHALVRCITSLESGEVLRSGAFKPAFSGRSSNNSGFISAVLLAEGLLGRDAERPHLLIDNARWSDWVAMQLAVGGDLPLVRIGKSVAEIADTPAAACEADADPIDAAAAADDAVGATDPGHLPAGDEVPAEPEHGKSGRKARKGRAVEAL